MVAFFKLQSRLVNGFKTPLALPAFGYCTVLLLHRLLDFCALALIGFLLVRVFGLLNVVADL